MKGISSEYGAHGTIFLACVYMGGSGKEGDLRKLERVSYGGTVMFLRICGVRSISARWIFRHYDCVFRSYMQCTTEVLRSSKLELWGAALRINAVHFKEVGCRLYTVEI